jgi:hypothetical protein
MIERWEIPLSGERFTRRLPEASFAGTTPATTGHFVM